MDPVTVIVIVDEVTDSGRMASDELTTVGCRRHCKASSLTLHQGVFASVKIVTDICTPSFDAVCICLRHIFVFVAVVAGLRARDR